MQRSEGTPPEEGGMLNGKGAPSAPQGQYIPPKGQNIAPQAMPQGQAEVAAIQPMVDRWQNDRPAQGRAVRGMQKAGRVLFIIGLVFAVVAVLMVVILAIKHADMALGTVLTMRTFGRVSLSLGRRRSGKCGQAGACGGAGREGTRFVREDDAG